MRSPAMPKRPRKPGAGGARRVLPLLRVAAVAGQRHKARIIAGSAVFSCVLGPAGITRRKREGDGATPAGSFRLKRLLFRPDRGWRPISSLRGAPISPRHGWCDDSRHARYNGPVRLPFSGSHERLWRDDRLYDLLVVLDYNLRPALKGRGSAIFLHVAAVDRTPTAGCVAVEPTVLRHLLGRVDARTRIVIG
jgi:L,D-peptidoglycan transpeptidase YkuD (ErfK/YbiS/YcfS/YnhG family)